MTNTYNTGNPLGSTDPRDLYNNASNFDDGMNSASPAFTDRLGVMRKSWSGMETEFSLAQSGRKSEFQQFLTNSGFVSLGNYAAGLNFTTYNQYMARDGFFYRPAPSSIPFTTTGTWVGGDENLFNLFSTDDVLRDDLANDTDPAKGAGLIGYRGRPLSTKLDTAKCFRDYGAVGDGVTDDTAPIMQALAENKYLELTPGKYVCKQPIALDGHTITGLGTAPEYYGQHDDNTVQIIFDGVTGVAITNTGSLSALYRIWFRQGAWSTALNAVRPTRYMYAVECMFTDFNGHGLLTYVDAGMNAPFHAVFERCQFLFNARNGAAILNGVNAVTLRDCLGRWNGAPARGVKPSTPGNWDGLFVDGRSPGIPASTTPVEPQVLLVEGGDWSYNSRYGQNWQRAFDSTLIGGYIELNLVGDLRLGGIFSTLVLNPMPMSGPTLELVEQDPEFASQNLTLMPNRIVIRGRNYGTGVKHLHGGQFAYREALGCLVSTGSESEVSLYSSPTGDIHLSSPSPSALRSGTDTAVCLKKFRLGVGVGDEGITVGGGVFLNCVHPLGSSVEGTSYFRFMNATGSTGEFFAASGTAGSSAPSFLRAPANSLTNRSISAGGTFNASGADYAEYMRKAEGCGDIQKGDICGVTANGELTDIYDCAIAFVVKSTDPAYVGGDTWNLPTPRPDQPDQDATAEEQQVMRAALEDFDVELEAMRQLHDRIAFAGQVPVSVMLAQPGDYIVPVRGENGGIGGEAISSPTFEQFRNSVGRVWKVQEDGRAWIVVKPC